MCSAVRTIVGEVFFWLRTALLAILIFGLGGWGVALGGRAIATLAGAGRYDAARSCPIKVNEACVDGEPIRVGLLNASLTHVPLNAVLHEFARQGLHSGYWHATAAGGPGLVSIEMTSGGSWETTAGRGQVVVQLDGMSGQDISFVTGSGGFNTEFPPYPVSGTPELGQLPGMTVQEYSYTIARRPRDIAQLRNGVIYVPIDFFGQYIFGSNVRQENGQIVITAPKH